MIHETLPGGFNPLLNVSLFRKLFITQVNIFRNIYFIKYYTKEVGISYGE